MRWDKSASNSSISFQVKMYEATGKIEFVYSPLSFGNPVNASASIGLAGQLAGDYMSVDSLGLNAGVSKTVETNSINYKPLINGLTFEFTPNCANIDGGVVSINTPANTGCYSANEPVNVTINNFGTTDISGFMVYVSITGANTQLLSGIYSGTITAGNSATFTVGNANMSNSGTYYFKAYTGIMGDINLSNDTSYATYYVSPSLPLPQYVNFTNYDGSNLSTLFNGWTEGQGGTIPTGTASAWNYAIGLGNPSNYTAKVNLLSTIKREWIIGPKIVPTNSTVLSFDAAVTLVNDLTQPSAMGSDDALYVMLSTNCGVSFTPIFTINASTGLSNTLTNFTLSLVSYSNTPVIVAFYATDGLIADPQNYDLHLDNINLFNVLPTDVGALSVINPTNYDNCFFTENFSISIKNYGQNTISGNAGVIISGPNSGTLTGTYTNLNSLNSTTINLGPFNMSASGTYTVKVFAKTGGDMNVSNDTLVYIYQSIKNGYPYLETFDGITPVGLPNGWKNDQISTETSLFVRITDLVYNHGAGNPPTKGLSTNLYIFNPRSWFITPLIGPIGSNAAVSFLYRITDNIDYINPGGLATNYSNNDSIIVYASTNCGQTWQKIGFINGAKHIPDVNFHKAQFCLGSSFTGQYVRIKNRNQVGAGDYWIDIDSLQVNTFSNPFIYSISNPVCPAQTATLIASGGDSYLWNTGSTNYSIIVTPTITSNYSVQVSTSNGCSGNAAITVSVFPQPTVNVTATSTNICSGGNTSLSQSGLTNFTWTSSIGNYTTNPVVVTLTGTTTFTVFGTDANGCSGSNSISILVSNNPNITISTTSNTLCSTNNVTLTANGASSYTWSTGSFTSTSNPLVYNPIVTSPSVLNFSVTGSSGPSCQGSSVLSLTAYPLPNISISANNNICVGSSATLAASGANTYTWTDGANIFNTPIIVVSPTSSVNYTITGTNTFGCIDVQTYNLNVVPLPTISISAASNSVCAGQIFTLSASGASGYNWYDGTNYYSGSVLTTSIAVNTTYTVTGQQASCSDTKTIQIIAVMAPTINVSASDNVLCNGGTVTLSAGGAASYTWTTPTGTLTGNNIVVTPTSNTTYSVQGSIGLCTSNTKTIQINVSVLNASITSIDAQQPVCNTGQATVAVTGGVPPYTYTWTPGNYNTATVNYLYPYTYTIQVKDANNCIANFTLTIQCVSSVEEFLLSNTTIYPNPTSSNVNIHFSDKINLDKITVKIFNVLGQEINTEIAREKYNLLINCKHLEDGVYLLKIFYYNSPSIESKFILHKN